MAIDPNRKGASSPSKVPPDVLAALNRGEIATVNLGEGLAIDTTLLLRTVAPELSKADLLPLTSEPKMGVMQRCRTAAIILHQHFGDEAIDRFATHPSDTVRGWVCFIFGQTDTPKWTLKKRLARIKPLADDPHFGVREFAWLGVRGRIGAQLDEAITLLEPWTRARSASVRRFATEATRPRGVWCAHLTELKDDPRRALPLLDPLKADPSKYVQDSVANWLNDAAKTRPDFVLEITNRWLSESETPATERIVKRARRGLG
jgi:3-methyladenine DNA glycosylase AlkC